MLTHTQTQSRSNAALWILIVLIAVTVGVAALPLWTLETKWALAATLLLLLPFMLMIVPDVRRFLLAGLILSLPLNADVNLFLQYGLLSGAHGLNFTLSDLLLLIAVLLWLLESARTKQVGAIRFYPKISWPTLGLIAMMAISLIPAQNRLWTLFDLFRFVKAYVLFLYLANNLRQRSDVRLVIQMLFIGVILQTVLSLWQINQWPGLAGLRLFGISAENGTAIKMDYFSTTRPGGTMESCNNLARFFGFLLPLAYVLSLRGETSSERWFARLTAVIGTVGIIYTLSRSTWIALIPSVLVLFPFMLSRRLLTLRIIRNLALMMMACMVVLLAFRDLIYDRIVSYDLGSGETRITSAQAAIRMIKANPVIGVGLNNYGNNAKYFYDGDEPRSRYWVVHNSYLLFAAEIGLVGFIFFLWFVLACFSSARRASLSRSKYLSAVALGVMSGWIGFFIAALADKSYKEFYVLVLTMWALAAVTEAVARLNQKYEQTVVQYLQDESVYHEL